MKLMEYLAPEMEVLELRMQKEILLVVSTDEGDDDNNGGDYDPSKPLG